jgi:toxin ParE1/3/4
MKVRLRAHAHQDIKDIFDWIVANSGNPPIAEKYAERIYDACEGLGNFPLKGRARDDLQTGVRILPFERTAVITYRVLRDEVEVLNIFYGGRDWEAFFLDDKIEDGEG